MAKKRRQKIEKKDDFDIKLPEFDEHQYISLEIIKAKVSLIAFIFAILMVIISYQLFLITYPDSRGPMVLGFFGVIGLPFLLRALKIDTDEFDWKNWVGSGAIYIMSWLAIFILVCNPPFSDFSNPEIDEEEIEIYYQKALNGSWQSWDEKPDKNVPKLAAPVRFNMSAKITDNTAVDKDSVKLTISGLTGSVKMVYFKDNVYRYLSPEGNQTIQKGIYNYKIEVKDIYDHKKIYEGRFEIIS